MSIFQNTIGSKSFICELGVLIYEIYNLATISFVGFGLQTHLISICLLISPAMTTGWQ